jgi:hypothetical protein
MGEVVRDEPERALVVHECGENYEKVLELMAGLNALSREYKVTALLDDRRKFVINGEHSIPRGKRHVWVIEEYVRG